MEAFSDGVIAIIITIMVLELRVPHGADLSALRPLAPVFLSYVLSFVYLGIYWNNHHHLLHAARHVDGRILWANLHLLFWLSLLPFVTHWTGENGFAALPVATYGVVLLMAGFAYCAARPRPDRPPRLGLRAGDRDRPTTSRATSRSSPTSSRSRWPSSTPGSRAPSTSPSRSSGWSRTGASSGPWPIARSSRTPPPGSGRRGYVVLEPDRRRAGRRDVHHGDRPVREARRVPLRRRGASGPGRLWLDAADDRGTA